MNRILLSILLITSLFAKETTFVREYTYQASDYDSKVTSRANALEQVKRLLLEEVSVFIISEVDWMQEETIIDGKYTLKDVYQQNIKSITAGITETIIIDEKWNGETYWLNAEITLNPDDIKGRINEIVRNKETLKELEDIKKKADASVAEIERLKKELAKSKSAVEQSKLTKAYIKETDILSASEWFSKGWGASMNKESEKAISYYLNCLDLDPKKSKCITNLGIEYDAQGYYTKAILYHEKAIELYPDKFSSYNNLGMTYGKLGNYTKSIQNFEKAITLEPNNLNSYFNMGISYMNMGNYTKSIQNFEKAITLEPNNSEAHTRLGAIYFELDDYKKQMFYYKKAAQLGNTYAQDWLKENGHTW